MSVRLHRRWEKKNNVIIVVLKRCRLFYNGKRVHPVRGQVKSPPISGSAIMRSMCSMTGCTLLLAHRENFPPLVTSHSLQQS